MHASWILWERVRAMAVMWGWLWPWISLKTAISSVISSTVGVLMLRMALATIQAPASLVILPAFTCSMRKAMQGLVAVMETRSRKAWGWWALISAGTRASIFVHRSLMSASPSLARVRTMIKVDPAASSCSKELSGALWAFVTILRKIRITFSFSSSKARWLVVNVWGALIMLGIGTWGLNQESAATKVWSTRVLCWELKHEGGVGLGILHQRKLDSDCHNSLDPEDSVAGDLHLLLALKLASGRGDVVVTVLNLAQPDLARFAADDCPRH